MSNKAQNEPTDKDNYRRTLAEMGLEPTEQRVQWMREHAIGDETNTFSFSDDAQEAIATLRRQIERADTLEQKQRCYRVIGKITAVEYVTYQALKFRAVEGDDDDE